MVNMSQHKIEKISKELPNVLTTIDDILIGGYDADRSDHKKTI